MRLVVVRYKFEPPGISIVPDTDYEAAVLSRYWESAKLSQGSASDTDNSANGLTYSIKFVEPGETK